MLRAGHAYQSQVEEDHCLIVQSPIRSLFRPTRMTSVVWRIATRRPSASLPPRPMTRLFSVAGSSSC